jgi:hypothetical protein
MNSYTSFQEMAAGTGALQQGSQMSVFNASPENQQLVNAIEDVASDIFNGITDERLVDGASTERLTAMLEAIRGARNIMKNMESDARKAGQPNIDGVPVSDVMRAMRPGGGTAPLTDDEIAEWRSRR